MSLCGEEADTEVSQVIKGECGAVQMGTVLWNKHILLCAVPMAHSGNEELTTVLSVPMALNPSLSIYRDYA